MECSVHSPCGRYLVRYKKDAESICIDVIPKVSAFEPSSTTHYVAVLRESHITEITTAAGVRKEFAGFADMTYNAMIGRSPCVKFFVETCEEMRNRIAAEMAQRGHEHSTIVNDSTDTSQLSESSRTQRFFTLDYDVDFTRAVFPVPLVQMTAAGEPQRPFDAHHGNVQQEREHVSRCTMPLNDRPAQVGANVSAAISNGNGDGGGSKAVIARLKAENEKLKRENESLARLSREKMLEMQRLCEDFQQGVEGAQEVERLRKKLSSLRIRLQRAEEERDEVHAALTRMRQQHALRATPQPDTHRRSAKATGRRSRFDTPSPAPRRRSSSRLLGDSPAPRGRTGGRLGSCVVPSRSRSDGSNGAAAATKKRLWADGSCSSRCSSRCSSASQSRCSCERLYRTPTASSRQHQRDAPVYAARRAIFR